MGSSSDQPDQELLSTFGAGDTDDIDLSVEDYDSRQRVEEYAQSVVCGGWEVALVTDEAIRFWSSDPQITKGYGLFRRGGVWVGRKNGKYPCKPQTDDLQEALDTAGEWMVENPIDDSTGETTTDSEKPGDADS